MRRLIFTNNEYGSWFCGRYHIEAYQGGFHTFIDNKLIGSAFTYLEGAKKFLEAYENNKCLQS